MENDFEQKYYKELTKVKTLEKDVKKLQSSCKKMTQQIAQFEIQGFHDQISKLDDEVKLLGSRHRELAEVVALNVIEALNVHMINAIRKAVSDHGVRGRMIEHMSLQCARARERAINNPSPLDVMIAFRQECMSCSKQYNLAAFV